MLGLKAITCVPCFTVLGLLLAATQLGPASGGVHSGAADCAQVGELVAFAAEQTGYPPLQQCPRASVTSAATLVAIVAPDAPSHGADLRAVYVAASGEILLSPDLDLAAPLGRSYLVHEFVHVHQFESGAHVRAPCVGWLEGEAYRVQASYLRMHGLAKDAFAFELLGLLQSACAHFYYK